MTLQSLDQPGDAQIRRRDKELTRLRAQQTVLRDALLDGQPAIELLADEVDAECDGLIYDPAFEQCGHDICKRVGCMKWKVGAAEQALATLDVPDTKEQT